jgi:hypothetical protein
MWPCDLTAVLVLVISSHPDVHMTANHPAALISVSACVIKQCLTLSVVLAKYFCSIAPTQMLWLLHLYALYVGIGHNTYTVFENF